ncbi:MAG TPA: M48 family metalloprotease [Planctomycetota bacterium]|nr:M48 family metalloprotease [Planctomycetota bacterium]
MGPFLGAIVAAAAATVALTGPAPRAPVGAAATLGAVAMALALVLLARGGGHANVRRRRAAGRPAAQVHPLERLLDLVGYFVLLNATAWPDVVRTWVPIGGLDALVAFTPYLAAASARVDATWPFDPRAQAGTWTRRQAFLFQARVLLVPTAPFFVVHAFSAWADGVPELRAATVAYEGLGVLSTVFGLLVVSALTPVFLRLLVGGRPLKDPTLLGDFRAFLARVRFRIPWLLRVETDGRIMNAVYVGLAAPLRAVLMTDAILGRLDRTEANAVFAHEVGHGVKRHLPLFVAFVAAIVVGGHAFAEDLSRATGAVGDAFAAAAGRPALASTLALTLESAVVVVAFFGGMWFLFGYVSRRLETEADLFAADAMGDAETFVRALEGVAASAGPAALRDGFRHFGVPRRVEIVRAAALDPAVRARWDRTFRRIRLAVFGVLLFSAARLALRLPEDLAEGRVRYQAAMLELLAPPPDAEGRRAVDVAAAERALDAMRPSLDDPRGRREAAERGTAVLMQLFDAALREGAFDRARELLRRAETTWRSDDAYGEFNRVHAAAQLAALEGDAETFRARAAADREALPALESRVRRERRGPPDPASLLETRQEIAFLAALAGVAPPRFDPEAFAASQVLASLAGENDVPQESAAEAWAKLPQDAAWRRVALERRAPALLGRGLEEAWRARASVEGNGAAR